MTSEIRLPKRAVDMKFEIASSLFGRRSPRRRSTRPWMAARRRTMPLVTDYS